MNRQITATHNTVLVIYTIATIAVITESIILQWEFWVPPLIGATLISAWIMHIMQFRDLRVRENYCLLFGMILAFYHGVHQSIFFDAVAVSAVFMTSAALLGRMEYLNFMLGEFFVIFGVQLALQNRDSNLAFDAQTTARILLHITAEICCYIVLRRIVSDRSYFASMITGREDEIRKQKDDSDNLVARISDELSKNLPAGSDRGLSRLVAEIGQYSNIRLHEVAAANEEYMTGSVMDSIMADTDSYVGKSGVRLIVDLDPSIPSRMAGDAPGIMYIIRQLLDNAFKFTNKGCVYLRVTGIRHDEGFNLVIEVTDTGIGMSTEMTEDISNGLYMKHRTEESRGIGIGLATVYGYVRAMNGFISIESSVGKGTTVKVSIAQTVTDNDPCAQLDNSVFRNVVYQLDPKSSRHPRVLEYGKKMADNLARSLRLNLYYASSVRELERFTARGSVTDVFAGYEEYNAARARYDELAQSVSVTVFTDDSAPVSPGIITIPHPVYSRRIIDVLNNSPSAGGRS